MSQTIGITLPGYNVLTDTNPDHYSLYADVDNVLIKRLLTGSATIADGSPTVYTIPHNLGYIPFFIVYVDNYSNGQWSIVNDQYNSFSVPQEIAFADITNLYIWNFGGHASGNAPFAWDIFYDNMSNTVAPSITESSQVIKVSRQNIDATQSTNPNDYIMHSDLNNFKILKQGNVSTTLTAALGYVDIPHGFTGTTPYKYFCFVKLPDGKTILTGGAAQTSYDDSITFLSSEMTSTNIRIYGYYTSDITISVYYLIYGTGVSGMVSNSGQELAVVASGKNVLTETNPDNFNFHSDYPTLKYDTSGSYSMTVSSETVYTIPHNLGYVPFFIGFVNDISGFTGTNAVINQCIMPYYWGRTPYPQPPQNIGAFIYADATNIYLKAYYQSSAVGTVVTFNFYYKIFLNNLGL